MTSAGVPYGSLEGPEDEELSLYGSDYKGFNDWRNWLKHFPDI